MNSLSDLLVKFFEDSRTSHVVYLHNQYCESAELYDDQIYDFETFFNELCDPRNFCDSVIRKLSNEFDGDDDYVWYNSCGYIASASERNISKRIDIDEIVRYIIENDDDLGDTDIRDILDEYEEGEGEVDEYDE